MLNFSVLLSNILLFAALAVPGYLLGKLKKINDASMASLEILLTNIAMPFLVLSKLLEADFSSFRTADILFCICLPPVLELILWRFSAFVFRPPMPEKKYPVSRFCSVFSNCGFLGIPIAEVMFPDHPAVVIYVSLFNISSTLFLLTFGMYILSGDKNCIRPNKAIFKPITWAILLGAFLSSVRANEHFPIIVQYSSFLAQLTTPLSMIVLGYELSKLKIKTILTERSLYPTAVIKLILSPLITMLFLKLCSSMLSEHLAPAMFLSAAVSTAASAPAMARNCNLDASYSASLTLGTTLFCIVVMPLLFFLFDFIF